MKDVQLYIDGNKMDIDENTVASITLSVSDITSPDSTQMGHTKTIDIPTTPRNRIFMQFTEQVFSKERFNNTQHVGVIESNGIRVMSGIVELKNFKKNSNGEEYYSVVIIGSTLEWIKRADAKISELTSDYTVKYQFDKIYANSVAASQSLIKFAPIDRGAYYSGGDLSPRTSLLIQDYHPFINVLLLLELILKGYTVKTSVREQLSELYVSGYIPEVTDDSIKEDNNFLAGSTDLVYAEYPDRFASPRSVRVFTDRTSGTFFGEEVVVLFYPSLPSTLGSYMVFKPTVKVTTAFEIALTYSTTVITDGYKLMFVDTVLFGGVPYNDLSTAKEVFSFSPNDSTGYPKGIENGRTYPPRATSEDTQWFIMFLRIKDASAIDSVWHMRSPYNRPIIFDPSLNGNFCLYIPGTNQGQYLEIRYKNGTSKRLDITDKINIPECYFIPMDYFDGKNTLRFEKTITTQSYTIDQGAKFPLTLAFGASNPAPNGTFIILSELSGCQVKPEFGGIGAGDDVSISTIGGDTTQLEFIQALRQMYNLNFYTNSITKEVFIEPGNAFYKSVIDHSVRLNDWTQKVDYLKSIEIAELGSDIGNTVKLAYKEGGDVVQKFNRKNKTELGAYTEALQNKITSDTKEIINPLYSPSVVRTVDSMGFTVIQCALETTKDTIQDVDLNIDPIIVCFAGVARRTAGSDSNTFPMYPMMLFQGHEQNVNMGFDDLPGDDGIIKGLRQYYENDIELWNNGRKITLYAKLEPRDIEPFLYPNDDFRDFRGRFKIKVNGEDVLCRIEKISDYNPNSGESTKIEVITGILPYNGEIPVETATAMWEGFVNVLEWKDIPEPVETATATWEDFVNVLESV